MTALATVMFLHPGHYEASFDECKTRMLLHDIYGNGRLITHDHGLIGKRCSSGGITAGRNAGTRQFLDESKAEWLLWLDSDMGFAEDTLERLIAAADPTERPAVGALCFAVKKDSNTEWGGRRYYAEPTLYMAPDLAPLFDYPRDEMVRVGATGAACLLVHRSALERIRTEWGDAWFDPVPSVTGGFFSEDLSFCIRLDKLDIPLFVHTGIKTMHDKGYVCFDEEHYDRQRKAVAV